MSKWPALEKLWSRVGTGASLRRNGRADVAWEVRGFRARAVDDDPREVIWALSSHIPFLSDFPNKARNRAGPPPAAREREANSAEAESRAIPAQASSMIKVSGLMEECAERYIELSGVSRSKLKRANTHSMEEHLERRGPRTAGRARRDPGKSVDESLARSARPSLTRHISGERGIASESHIWQASAPADLHHLKVELDSSVTSALS